MILKYATIFAIVAISVSVSTSFSVSASSVLGDINGDGMITLSDSVSLGKFLIGELSLSDPSVADTDANGIIDITDQNILSGFLVGSVKSLPYTG